MAHQTPSSNHPWRRYKDKINEKQTVRKKEIFKGKTVKIFVKEIVDSWDEVEIITVAYGREGRFTLSELPQEKQANWLIGIIKKLYQSQEQPYGK